MRKRPPSPLLADAVRDHDAEGIDILAGRSSRAARAVLYLFVCLLAAGFAWSFFGKADVVVTAQGQLEPKLDMRKVYVPIAGEIIDLYVTEGAVVAKNDLLARIKATDAIKAATDAEQAKIRLERAELERSLFPQKKALYQKELANIEKNIQQKEKELALYQKDKLKNLPAIQRHKLNKARIKLRQAAEDRDAAREIYEKYDRLYSSGNGGVSRKEVEEHRNRYLKADTDQENAAIDLDNLEYEFSQQKTRYDKRINDAAMELLRFRFEHRQKLLRMEDEEKQVEIGYRAAKAAWDAASGITFDDIDDQNYLRIRAPVDGEVTFVSARQRGEKIKPDIPLLSIAPADTEKMVAIRIADRDRGLLKVGMDVSLKFAAFPFHRYGRIDGTLEYLSPDAMVTKEGGHYYEGRVGIERDFFLDRGAERKLRYGMTADAEISVRKRRIIDWLLDPFRKFSEGIALWRSPSKEAFA